MVSYGHAKSCRGNYKFPIHYKFCLQNLAILKWLLKHAEKNHRFIQKCAILENTK